MEPFVLLELLKFLWIAYEVVFHLRTRKREKALIATIESVDQRLIELENELKRKL